MNRQQELARFGENYAVHYLRKKNYRIIDRNYFIWGGEIDIIAKDLGTDEIVFVEVKSRRDDSWKEMDDILTFAKKVFLRKAIQRYILEKGFENYNWRFDYVGLLVPFKGKIQVTHLEDVALISYFGSQ